MLSTALPNLQNDLKSALEKSSKTAAYSAVLSMWGNSPTEDTDKIADNFADTFSKLFAEKASPLLSQAIYSFIMQAQPYATVIPVTTPAGPGNGVAVPGTIIMQ